MCRSFIERCGCRRAQRQYLLTELHVLKQTCTLELQNMENHRLSLSPLSHSPRKNFLTKLLSPSHHLTIVRLYVRYRTAGHPQQTKEQKIRVLNLWFKYYRIPGKMADLALVGLPSFLPCSTFVPLPAVATCDVGEWVVEGGGRERMELADRDSHCCSLSEAVVPAKSNSFHDHS